MKSRNTSILIVSAIFLSLSSPAFAYRDIIDLGTLGGQQSQAASINNSGAIVGVAQNSDNYPMAVRFGYANGQNTDLGGLPPGSANTSACSINNYGQIVGIANGKACLFDSTGGNANTDLGSLGGSGGTANYINNNNKIVGWANISSGYHRACLFDSTGNGNNINLGTLGGSHSWAQAINDSGMIVGHSYTDSTIRACIFDSTGNGANIDLGSLSDNSTTQSYAYSVNNAGQIAGSAMNSFFFSRACLFDSTGHGNNIDLGTLGAYEDSLAYSINNLGQVVGFSYSSSKGSRAALFDPTGHGNNINLNTLINPASGWTLTIAYGINDNGWIVGTGINSSGQEHAFLLTPEPATILLFALGGLALRRKR